VEQALRIEGCAEVGASNGIADRSARRVRTHAAFSPALFLQTLMSTGTATAEALRLEGVHKSFGDFNALTSIELVIPPGELVCFLGPSGCGKTTLLRIIAGLEQQTRGRILQNGRDVSNAPPAARDYGIVFQSYALFPNLTISENVAYGLVNRRKGRAEIAARVQELLDLVGLADAGRKYPSQMSGGQQQRVALARALATSPSLLLLDEPLSALDAKVRERLRGEIRQLQRRLQVTTIMVTHDQEEALSMADRVVVMNNGHIEQIGSPSDVYERPATPFVADFLGKANVLNGVALGGGVYQVGSAQLVLPADEHRAGQSVRIYVRPEDRHVEGDVAALPNRLRGRIVRIDYLGTICLAELRCEAIGQPMLISYSLNQLHDLNVREGGEVEIALRVDRVRVFAEPAQTD
jgi:iron(III) transport system ATP-binding protein